MNRLKRRLRAILSVEFIIFMILSIGTSKLYERFGIIYLIILLVLVYGAGEFIRNKLKFKSIIFDKKE